jgi:chromosome partitioning protein
MSLIISVSNHKGGVGKTTSAINIGSCLSQLGSRVLLIDLDPQANLSISLGVHEREPSIYRILTEQSAPVFIQVSPTLFIIPSNIDLSAAEIEMSTKTERELKLKDVITPIREGFDYIIIDCPPSLGLLTVNALCLSDLVLIPVQAEYFSIRGIGNLLKLINMIQKRLNTNLRVSGMFITQYDKRKNLNREIENKLIESYGALVYDTKIRDNVSLSEASAQKKSIFSYLPACNGAEDYKSLCKEFLENEKEVIELDKSFNKLV